MTTYYVDPAATGANNGTSWENAWTALQSAATNAAAGDTVYCRGTETITAEVDFAASGAWNSYIKFIGCNAAGTNDGTFYVINGNDGNINGFDVDGDYLWFENFKIHSCNATAAIDCSTTNSDYCIYLNIWCHDNEAYGFYANAYARYARFIRCRFSNNTSGGVYRTTSSTFFACTFNNNTGDGYTEASRNELCSCIFRNNSGRGAYIVSTLLVTNCIFEANGGDGCYLEGYTLFIGCRFTNNNAASKYGLNVATSYISYLFGCYFGNNATDIKGQYHILPLDGSTTHVTLSGSETEHGYVSPGSPDYDYNLDPTKAANTRSIAIELD